MFSLLNEAKQAGVILSLTPAGTVQASGDPGAVNAFLPRIREHKAAIVELLTPRHWWRLHFPDLPTINVCSVPGSTFAEIMANYPAAVAAEPFTPVTEAPDTALTASEERAIRDWCASIGEDDPATISECLSRCRTDQNARSYFLRRAAEAVIAERELFEERAAIIEHDGGLPRDEAERLALDEVIRRRATRTDAGDRQ